MAWRHGSAGQCDRDSQDCTEANVRANARTMYFHARVRVTLPTDAPDEQVLEAVLAQIRRLPELSTDALARLRADTAPLGEVQGH